MAYSDILLLSLWPYGIFAGVYKACTSTERNRLSDRLKIPSSRERQALRRKSRMEQVLRRLHRFSDDRLCIAWRAQAVPLSAKKEVASLSLCLPLGGWKSLADNGDVKAGCLRSCKGLWKLLALSLKTFCLLLKDLSFWRPLNMKIFIGPKSDHCHTLGLWQCFYHMFTIGNDIFWY